ncbi:MAG: FAD-dependent oxidoreductase [Alphaproteobacteria bacterium]|nr:FAD-dependent oxidoreductase [Alphaproteobacteria bacterium]
MERIVADICVIGAGSGGLSVAAGAAQMGARTVLIERHMRSIEGVGEVMGGDCLHTGCVPSKALLAAAKRAHAMASAAPYGIAPGDPRVDFAKVNAQVKETIARISPIDSRARFEGLGVRVLAETARFVSPRELVAGEATVASRWFVLATGSVPAVPPIPGLDSVPYLTNESLFDLQILPEHLAIIGGGPIGIEMAQAHRRLGARVTVIESRTILGKDDPEAVALVRARLAAEGVEILEEAGVERVAAAGTGIRIAVRQGSAERDVEATHLLVATGRKVETGGLGLDAAGVRHGPRGIEVDARLRTSNRRIFAMGDAAGGLQFTHVAGYHAGIVVRNALLRLPTKSDTSLSPAVTYTDPELAQVGLTEAQARERHGRGVTVWRAPFADNDRARAERDSDGFVKVVAGPSGRILGATIVGPSAGELVQIWTLALARRLKLSALTGIIAPYPTLGESSKRAAGAYYTPFVFGPLVRMAVRLLRHLPN